MTRFPRCTPFSDVRISRTSHKRCEEVHSSTTWDVWLRRDLTSTGWSFKNPDHVHVRPLTSRPGSFLPTVALLVVSPVERFLVNELVVDERRVRRSLLEQPALASALLRIPAGSRYSGDMKQLEVDEFSNWWLKGADVAFIQLVRSSSSMTQYPKKEIYQGEGGIGLNGFCPIFRLFHWRCLLIGLNYD